MNPLRKVAIPIVSFLLVVAAVMFVQQRQAESQIISSNPSTGGGGGGSGVFITATTGINVSTPIGTVVLSLATPLAAAAIPTFTGDINGPLPNPTVVSAGGGTGAFQAGDLGVGTPAATTTPGQVFGSSYGLYTTSANPPNFGLYENSGGNTILTAGGASVWSCNNGTGICTNGFGITVTGANHIVNASGGVVDGCNGTLTVFGGGAAASATPACLTNFSRVGWTTSMGSQSAALVTPAASPGAACAQPNANATSVLCVAPAGLPTSLVNWWGY